MIRCCICSVVLSLVAAVGQSKCVWGGPIAKLAFPSIKGNVYHLNEQRAKELLPGVELQLYHDDGDGVFTSSDTYSGIKAVTDASGGYSFGQLASDRNYFVVQPEQTVGGQFMQRQVSVLKLPAQPNVTIDQFDITQSVEVNALSGSRMGQVSAPTSFILGGERDAYLELIGGKADVKLRSNPYSLTSTMQFDAAAGVKGRAVITWDGVDNSAGMTPSAGLGKIDFTFGGLNDGILLRMGVDAAGEGQTVLLKLFSNNAAQMSIAEVSLPVTERVAPNSYIYVPFSEFIGNAAPTSVDAFQLILESKFPSVDAQFDEISLIGPARLDFEAIMAVPEPNSLAVWACALVLSRSAFLRRRRNSVEATV